MDDDYGLDFHIEVFESEQATGDAFYVQLKGTSQSELAKALRARLRVDTADHWSRQALPVLVVIYHAPSEGLYTQWFHAFDPHVAGLAPEWREQETFTFTVPESRVWVDTTSRQLAAELTAYRTLRGVNFSLPLRFFVSADPDVGASALDLASQLTRAANRVDHIVRFSATPAHEGALTLHVATDAIAANLAGVASVTSHRGTAMIPLEAVPFDALLTAGAALDRVRRPDLAAQVVLCGIEGTTLLDLPDTVSLIADILSRADRLGDALQIAELLLHRGDDDSAMAAFAFLSSYWAYGPGVRRAHRDRFHLILEDVFESRVAEGDMISAAALSYSLGNSAREAEDIKEALRGYFRAARLDPNYRAAAYWNAEIAGMLWGRGHYLIASDFYRKGVELGATEMRGHLGDALLYAGRYAEAHAAFLTYLEEAESAPADWSSNEPAPEWVLKAGVLADIRRHGGDSQRRDAQSASHAVEAALAAGGRDRVAQSLREALKLDALSPEAWHWLAIFEGIDERNRERNDPAVLACGMLIVALVLRHSPDAWRNALVALWQRDRASHDFRRAVSCARFLTGDDVLAVLSGADEWAPDEAADMMRVVAEADDPRQPRGYKIRLRQPDGSYYELVVASEEGWTAVRAFEAPEPPA